MNSQKKSSSCPHTEQCPLFPKLILTLSILKKRYCDADYSDCIRYQMSCEGKTVPPTLLPNGRELTLPDNQK